MMMSRSPGTFPLIFGYLIPLLAVGFLISCEPQPESQKDQTLAIDFSDSTFTSLWYAQMREDTAMIRSYLMSEDPMRQYAALMALSATPSADFTSELLALLDAPQKKIRTRAAFALGQSRDRNALPTLKNAFDNKDSLMQNQHFNATVLEAVGKIGGPREALEIIKISTYSPRDSILNLGRLRALYQLALQGHELKEVHYFMMEVIGQALHPLPVRAIAADYLARFSSAPFDSLQFTLLRAFERTKDLELKRQLARSLPKCTASKAREWQISVLANLEADETLRLICTVGLLDERPAEGLAFFRPFLEDEHKTISQWAAHYFYKYGNPHDALEYAEWAKAKAVPQATRFILLSAALKHLPFYYQLSKNTITKELLGAWSKDLTHADRKVLIAQLAASPQLFDELLQIGRGTESESIRTDILSILKDQYCSTVPCSFTRVQQKQMIPYIKSMLQEETGSQTLAAGIASRMGIYLFEREPLDSSFLNKLYASLQWPRQLEAGRALETLMDSLDVPYEKKEVEASIQPNPRIWQRITDSTRLVVELPQGVLRIALLPQEAPLTVAQLIAEVESGFYNGKLWHRVVPNFVLQTGCPTGHGFDSGDFLLPTEVSPYAHYHSAGVCGMASIGPHTESTQWFITLRATPHLDGKYTIWGHITEGLSLLQTVEEDDKIQSISIENLVL